MQELLKQFDLDEHEAKIYLALLELGPSTVTEVTKKSGVARTLGYLTLDKLGWKGLVTRVQDAGKKIKYVAENPRNFLQYVKNKKHVWENRMEKAETLLPDLMSLYKIEDKPVIRFQEGARAVMNLFEESLNSKTEILAVLDVESWNKPEFWDWAKKYNRERNKRKIKERILILDTPKGREWIKSYRGSPHTVYRWITREQAKGLLEFGGELNIYENKVVVAMLRKHQMLAIIESAILTNILRSMFNIIWEVAQPVKIKK
ncbi:MAG: helix-turn-helix domain-containing protein [Candidatus Magasanikbacteria bacterium]